MSDFTYILYLTISHNPYDNDDIETLFLGASDDPFDLYHFAFNTDTIECGEKWILLEWLNKVETLSADKKKELEDRLGQMGYDPKLPDDKVRLVENPKKFMEEYIDNLLKQKGKDNDVLSKEEEVEEVEINPIVAKQIKSLKNSMKTYGLKPDHILKGLKDDNE